jgi:hypothetical protein
MIFTKKLCDLSKILYKYYMHSMQQNLPHPGVFDPTGMVYHFFQDRDNQLTFEREYQILLRPSFRTDMTESFPFFLQRIGTILSKQDTAEKAAPWSDYLKMLSSSVPVRDVVALYMTLQFCKQENLKTPQEQETNSIEELFRVVFKGSTLGKEPKDIDLYTCCRESLRFLYYYDNSKFVKDQGDEFKETYNRLWKECVNMISNIRTVRLPEADDHQIFKTYIQRAETDMIDIWCHRFFYHAVGEQYTPNELNKYMRLWLNDKCTDENAINRFILQESLKKCSKCSEVFNVLLQFRLTRSANSGSLSSESATTFCLEFLDFLDGLILHDAASNDACVLQSKLIYQEIREVIAKTGENPSNTEQNKNKNGENPSNTEQNKNKNGENQSNTEQNKNKNGENPGNTEQNKNKNGENQSNTEQNFLERYWKLLASLVSLVILIWIIISCLE